MKIILETIDDKNKLISLMDSALRFAGLKAIDMVLKIKDSIVDEIPKEE